MPCSAKYSVTLQTEILSTETLDFLKQIFFSSPGRSPGRAIVHLSVCVGIGVGVDGGVDVSKMLKFLRSSFLCDGRGAVRRAILSL